MKNIKYKLFLLLAISVLTSVYSQQFNQVAGCLECDNNTTNNIPIRFDPNLQLTDDRAIGADKIIKQIERQLSNNFSDYYKAIRAWFSNSEIPQVRTIARTAYEQTRFKTAVKTSIKRRCLANIKLLNLRLNEIKSGNTNNSQYRTLKYNDIVIKDIKDINKLNAFIDKEESIFFNNEFNLRREFKVQALFFDFLQKRNWNNSGPNWNHEVMLPIVERQMHWYYGVKDVNKRVSRMQSFVFGQSRFLSLVEQGDLDKYVWGQYPLSSFVLRGEEREALLNNELNALSENEFKTLDAITGLGTRNSTYINNKPILKAEIENYLSINNYSKGANDCINYLLNQYLGNNTFFTLGQDYYSSASRPILNSPASPTMALGTSLNSLAIRDQFTYFNNVLAALLNDNVHRPEYKGQIIREMFTANNISIPAGIDNEALSTYFDFAPTDQNRIRIEHTGNHGTKNNLSQYLRDLKEFHDGVQSIINTPVPTGASTVGYIDYENRIAEVLSFTNDQNALDIAELFQTDAARNAYLSLEHHRAITDRGRNIIKTGFPEQLEFQNLDPEGLKIITRNVSEVAAIDDIAQEVAEQDTSFWPQNPEEWEAFVDVMAPLLGEVILGFIPGSDAIALFQAIGNEDVVGASIAMGGLVVDLAGLRAVRGAIRATRVFRKGLIIGRKLGRALSAAGKAARRGFKTVVENGQLVLRRGEQIIAVGDDATRRVLANIADAVNDAQRNIISRWSDDIATATNKQKGNFGEMATDLKLADEGYIPLHTRIDNIDAPGHTGIDAVFEKNGQYFIVESKFSKTTTPSLTPANASTGLPKQMSDAWIQRPGELANVIGDTNLADDIIDAGYTRVVATHGPNGATIFKEVSSQGVIGNVWTP